MDPWADLWTAVSLVMACVISAASGYWLRYKDEKRAEKIKRGESWLDN